MIEYPDPREHFEEYITRAVEKYKAGLERAGLKPSDKLNNAMIKRIKEDAQKDYEGQCARVLVHNIKVIDAKYDQRKSERKWWEVLADLIMMK